MGEVGQGGWGFGDKLEGRTAWQSVTSSRKEGPRSRPREAGAKAKMRSSEPPVEGVVEGGEEVICSRDWAKCNSAELTIDSM